MSEHPGEPWRLFRIGDGYGIEHFVQEANSFAQIGSGVFDFDTANLIAVSVNNGGDLDAYKGSLKAATARVEELEVSVRKAIEHCQRSTTSPAGRHVVELAIMELRAALDPSAQSEVKPEACEWHQAEEFSDTWHGSCGIDWTLMDDTPDANGMRFCPRCGKPLEVKP